MTAVRERGTIKFFNGERGFGFIKPDADLPDVFLAARYIPDGIRVSQHMRVEYSRIHEARGPRAGNVKVLG